MTPRISRFTRIALVCSALVCSALVFSTLAGPADAQDLPALHDVTGVTSDDVLNVRAGPNASADIIGDLAHDATGVEVTAIDGNWGRVNTGEWAGWVSRDFLVSQPGQQPQGFLGVRQCFGTEPFWNLTVTETAQASWTTPDGPERQGVVPGRFKSANLVDTEGLAVTFTDLSRVYAVVHRQECSDGMSDRLYGLSVDLYLLEEAGPSRLYSGCCSLEPN